MSRTTIRLALGAALLLTAAACSSQPTNETIPDAEGQKASSSDAANTEAQSPESTDRPIVTVNLSPT